MVARVRKPVRFRSIEQRVLDVAEELTTIVLIVLVPLLLVG
jgi:hypothetical protein